jgi:tRNA nucleotidyltransferase/poly(A) polymerase
MKEIVSELARLGWLFRALFEVKGERRLYLVGGTIRDILLGSSPQDFDFAVEGSGCDFAQRFARRIRGAFIPLDLSLDEARVVYRRSLCFDFTGLGARTIQDDLARRDFRIDAIALDLDAPDRLIDPYEGLTDLSARRIRLVSPQSLKLDPLRVLRSFRLAQELDFELDPGILDEIPKVNIIGVAAERIAYELLRIMEGANSYKYLKLFYKLGLCTQLFPEATQLFRDAALSRHSLQTYQVVEEILKKKNFFNRFQPEYENYLQAVPFRRALLKLAGLFHDISKPETEFETPKGDVHFYGHDALGAQKVEEIARRRLRLSKPQILMLKTLVARHMHLHLLATSPVLTPLAIRRFFRLLGDEYFGVFILCYADGYATAGRIEHLEATIQEMMDLKRADEAKAKVKRLVTGDDLIELGLKPGPVFRPILEELDELQLEGRIKTKEEGLQYLKDVLFKEWKRVDSSEGLK